MRKALIVGIDNYHNSELECCVNDAKSIQALLDDHDDGNSNFDVKVLTDEEATKHSLEEEINELFNDDDVEIGLFYFSGHGYKDDTGAYLSTYDYTKNNPGVSLDYLLKKVNSSKCKNKVVILDCCSSGYIGKSNNILDNISMIGEGVVIFASCKDSKKALDNNGHGVFTGLLIEGLKGTASDILGRVYLLHLYSYISRSLSSWKQRPMLKCNITHDVIIRKSDGKLKIATLKSGMKLFENPDAILELDPTYYDFTKGFDPIPIQPIKDNEKKFKLLLDLYRNQLIHTDCNSLYTAAKTCSKISLTADGKFYWNQVHKKMI